MQMDIGIFAHDEADGIAAVIADLGGRTSLAHRIWICGS